VSLNIIFFQENNLKTTLLNDDVRYILQAMSSRLCKRNQNARNLNVEIILYTLIRFNCNIIRSNLLDRAIEFYRISTMHNYIVRLSYS
jgi:hypothetical protein